MGLAYTIFEHTDCNSLPVKTVSHWTATVGNKLRREFASELKMYRNVRGFSMSSVQSYGHALVPLEKCKIFARHIFSQNSHRVDAGVSNPC